MTTKPTGYVIYKGRSLINGARIVAIALIKSSNRKTGNLVQTYILPDNGESPIDNIKSLADESVCGDCKHRRGIGGACYVNVGQGVTAVWKAYMRGNYPLMPAYRVASLIKGRQVRLGTYGDPMAVPYGVWNDLLLLAAGHTGYSHQWSNQTILNNNYDQYYGIKALCMASVDSDDEYVDAWLENWRTFRVRRPDEFGLRKGEFICPASEEAGKRKTCADCMACDGIGDREEKIKKATPVIVVHGALKNRFLGLTK